MPVTLIRKKGPAGLSSLCLLICLSCSPKNDPDNIQPGVEAKDVLVHRRSDGTLSSVNQIDEMGIVHGLRVTYYPDGKTVFSKLTLNHGIKDGPSIRYYKNGQVFEHTGYKDGQRHGLTRKYYKDGKLMAEYTYDNGILLPGLKEYFRDGSRVTGYPEILFVVEDHLDSRNRIDLRIYSKPVNRGIKYYVKLNEKGQENRVYLISENGSAVVRRYVRPGSTMHETIGIIAEIPTQLGNTLVRDVAFDLKADN